MDGLVFTPSAAPHATRAPCAVHAALHGTPSVRPGAGGAAFGAVSGLVAALVASQAAKAMEIPCADSIYRSSNGVESMLFHL